MRGRDHSRTGQLGAGRHRMAIEAHQIGNEQEQASHPRGELAWREDEVVNIGHRLSKRPHPNRPLVVAPARQRREAFLCENFAYRGGAEWRPLLLQGLADFVDRIVALAQRHDLLVGTALLGLLAGSRADGGEELRKRAVTKPVTQHTECPNRIAKSPRRLG